MLIELKAKDLKNVHCYAAGYCRLKYLLMYQSTDFYTASKTYGWCSDVYKFDNFYLSTGYVPIGKYLDYAICVKYDNKAKQIYYNHNFNMEQKEKKINNLLKKFIVEVQQ